MGRRWATTSIIYSSDQFTSWTFVGGRSFSEIASCLPDAGLINQNCVVEAEKMHYCFGRETSTTRRDDQAQSIADEKVKNFIFKAH